MVVLMLLAVVLLDMNMALVGPAPPPVLVWLAEPAAAAPVARITAMPAGEERLAGLEARVKGLEDSVAGLQSTVAELKALLA